MTPDELPNPPPKASWKRWLVVLAGALAIVLAVLFLKAPAPERVSVWFASSFDLNGKKMLVFHGTNGLPRSIAYYAYVIPTSFDPSHYKGPLPSYDGPAGSAVGAGETFSFVLEPPTDRTDWRVMWWFMENGRPMTRWASFRMRCAAFCRAHGMRKLATRFGWLSEPHLIAQADLQK